MVEDRSIGNMLYAIIFVTIIAIAIATCTYTPITNHVINKAVTHISYDIEYDVPADEITQTGTFESIGIKKYKIVADDRRIQSELVEKEENFND